MKQRNSWFNSILTVKCPRCREGNMFPAGTLYHPKKFMQMNKNCECCGQSFEPEPGYYFGAMFISYAFNTAFFVGVWWALLIAVDEISIPMMLGVLLFVVIGLLPLNFRWSRVLWINIFVRYEGPCKNMVKK
jgi:phage FluMu protein Com